MIHTVAHDSQNIAHSSLCNVSFLRVKNLFVRSRFLIGREKRDSNVSSSSSISLSHLLLAADPGSPKYDSYVPIEGVHYKEKTLHNFSRIAR